MANEKRLIDAGDLWSDIMMLPHNGDMISSEEVENAIKEAPTVDAVEVVRREKCLYYDDSGDYCRFWRGVRHPEHYCGEGERKDNELV